MAKYRSLARILAIAVCLAANSCDKEVAAPPKPPPGPCFLFFSAGGDTIDGAEVLVDGRSLGVLKPKRPGGPIESRLTFTSSASTRIVVRVLKGDTLLYQPEFETATVASDMLECQCAALVERTPNMSWGPTPSHYFPALAEGVPAKISCCFGPANAKTDVVIMRLANGEDAAAFKARAAEKYYKVINRSHPNEFRVSPPEGVTLVEAVLDIESWPGPKQIYFEPNFFY